MAALKILFTFIFLTAAGIQAEIALPEGQQVALESAKTLLVNSDLGSKLGIEIPRIRTAYRNVSSIMHQPQWAPGELLAFQITDRQIQSLFRSKYGLISAQRNEYNGAHLIFKFAYNPVNLANVLQYEYGFQSEPNNYLGLSQRITYNLYRKEYLFERGWGDCAFGWPCLYSHYWVFREESDAIIRLVNEGGDSENLPSSPPTDGAVSDEPQKPKPHTYAPTRKHGIQFGR